MRNRPYGFEIYLVNVKTMKTIAQIFLAFSEKLNFKQASKSKLVISSEATPWCLIYFMSKYKNPLILFLCMLRYQTKNIILRFSHLY